MEQSRLEEIDVQREQEIESHKARLSQIERINLDLERQVQEQLEEIKEHRNEQRQRREEVAMR